MSTITITFTVHGKPISKGSMRAMKAPSGHAFVIPDNKAALQQWHGAISQEAADTMAGRKLFRGGIVVEVAFYFQRLKGHYGTGRNATRLKQTAPNRHAKKPDIDKLERALLDALSKVVFVDDCQVDEVHKYKHWTETGARAEITITAEDLGEAEENHDGR